MKTVIVTLLGSAFALLDARATAQAVDEAVLEFTQFAEVQKEARLWRIGDEGFSQRSYLERLAGLSPEQMQDLLRARSTLVEFFSALESDTDAFRFMTDDFAEVHPDQSSLYRSLIGYETSLLQVAITGFKWVQGSGDVVELFFNATTFVEGEIYVNAARATLKRVGTEWRVADVASADQETVDLLLGPRP
jgi:hypothetical protein